MGNFMKIIGITGGVGAGKTQVLSYIEAHYNCRIIRADEAAHLLYEPGQECYQKLVELMGKGILQDNGEIDKLKMASIIFNDKEILEKVNNIVHPAVKSYITGQIETERALGRYDWFFVEAALLIEEHYDEIVDEMWYIYADEAVRSKRLSSNRNYSDDKIMNIMKGQLSDSEFRKHCQKVICNNGDLDATYKEIRNIMGDDVYESVGNQR
jgi:dephospho-CoA kinase